MTAEMGSGNLWGQGSVLDDEAGAWDWLRVHRIYCTAVLAIIVATLYGAHWAGQPARGNGHQVVVIVGQRAGAASRRRMTSSAQPDG